MRWSIVLLVLFTLLLTSCSIVEVARVHKAREITSFVHEQLEKETDTSFKDYAQSQLPPTDPNVLIFMIDGLSFIGATMPFWDPSSLEESPYSTPWESLYEWTKSELILAGIYAFLIWILYLAHQMPGGRGPEKTTKLLYYKRETSVYDMASGMNTFARTN